MSALAAPPQTPDQPPARKKLVRRAGPDRSQAIRRAVQGAFLALNVWIGVEFYFFVRYYETGGQSLRASRPPGVEGWLPIASLMNLKALLLTGEMPGMHAAGMLLLLAFLAMSWIFRKSFCGWLCPVGALSEYLWRLGRQTFGRNFRIPRRLDIALRSLKYLLLAMFGYAVGSMSVAGIRAFLDGPYGIVADVKMLNFFRFLGLTGAAVMAAIVIASVFVQNFWCRYLCPYGALMGLVSMASPLRIRRDESACIDCGKCAKACPSALPVDRLITIQSAECTGCLQCVADCPAAGALFLSAPRRRPVPAWAVAAGTVGLFVGAWTYGLWSGSWHTQLPERVYFELVPHANEFGHP
jgi:polyferredoxin